jgi:XTP/dITP diphosphohydrolase
LGALAEHHDPSFPARFRCCLALVRGNETLQVTHGAVEGRIILEEQGEGGFGYDALFIPEGYDDSFGVLPTEVKNQLSHRARALENLCNWLRGQNLT